MQENIKDTNILLSFCNDHSPLFVNYPISNDFNLGKHFWKFNSSLTKDEKYVKQMKELIQNAKYQFDPIFKEKPQAQWEFLKYEIRKFSIAFSKMKSKEKREKGKLREFEQNLNCDENVEQCGIYKNELNNIYNDISNGIKIRSKCDWYEFGEKSNKFFLNLEATRATQSVVRKVISNKQEITDIFKINNHILQFYQNLFKEKQSTSENRFNSLLNDLNIPSLRNALLQRKFNRARDLQIINKFY